MNTLPALDSDGRVMAQYGKTFATATRLLGRRDAGLLHTLYSFCRFVDDLADDSDDREQARRQLDQIGRALTEDEPLHTWARAVRELHQAHGLSLGPVRELVRGVRSDLDREQMADGHALLDYCYQVAGTVGLMICDVLGVASPLARRYAIDLGIAMQLTNIARDVQEDAENGRIYLPASWLGARAPSDIANADTTTRKQVQATIKRVLDIADEHYRRARAGYGFLPFRARLAVAVAARNYQQIGRILARRQCAFWLGRVVVPRHQKLRLASAQMLRLVLTRHWPTGTDTRGQHA